jgi:hypothetical protein
LASEDASFAVLPDRPAAPPVPDASSSSPPQPVAMAEQPAKRTAKSTGLARKIARRMSFPFSR